MRTTSGHYRVPVVDFKAQAIYTNNHYAGSFAATATSRPPTPPRSRWTCWRTRSTSTRWRSTSGTRRSPGEVTPQQSFLRECALAECLSTAAQTCDYSRKRRDYAARRDAPAATRRASASLVDPQRRRCQDPQVRRHRHPILKLDDYARVTPSSARLCGASEIGQGIDAVINLIVAEELGVPLLRARHDREQRPPTWRAWDVGVARRAPPSLPADGTRTVMRRITPRLEGRSRRHRRSRTRRAPLKKMLGRTGRWPPLRRIGRTARSRRRLELPAHDQPRRLLTGGCTSRPWRRGSVV